MPRGRHSPGYPLGAAPHGDYARLCPPPTLQTQNRLEEEDISPRHAAPAASPVSNPRFPGEAGGLCSGTGGAEARESRSALPALVFHSRGMPGRGGERCSPPSRPDRRLARLQGAEPRRKRRMKDEEGGGECRADATVPPRAPGAGGGWAGGDGTHTMTRSRGGMAGQERST